jgi:hypothetical protein
VSVIQDLRTIQISGIEGKSADANGSYDPTDEKLEESPVFQHTTNQNYWLRMSPNGKWVISGTKNKNLNNNICLLRSRGPKCGLPSQVPSWELFDGTQFCLANVHVIEDQVSALVRLSCEHFFPPCLTFFIVRIFIAI